MSVTGWFILTGLVLLSMGLTASRVRRLPISTAICYLAVGLLIGPTVLNLFHFNPLQQAHTLEIITEIAVLLSLFSAGLKLQAPLRSGAWAVPLRLAFASLALTVALIAAFGYYVLGLPLGAAVLLGGILAPTDPVLATDVQVADDNDRDNLRFGLTGEAGVNDGSAFPFIMLGMTLLGLERTQGDLVYWLWHDLLWASCAGIAIGALCGYALAHAIAWFRSRDLETRFMDDFLGLGLIAFTYGIALLLETYAFLAVFAAAVVLRQTERRLEARSAPAARADSDTPVDEESEQQIIVGSDRHADRPAPMSNVALHFSEQLERISEVALIILLGGMLFVNSWTWQAVLTGLFLFVVARPISLFFGLIGSRATRTERGLMAWFGVRGIGSLYYLMYVINHGLPENLALEMLSITLVVMTLSILLHGASVTPLMRWYASQTQDHAADEAERRAADKATRQESG